MHRSGRLHHSQRRRDHRQLWILLPDQEQCFQLLETENSQFYLKIANFNLKTAKNNQFCRKTAKIAHFWVFSIFSF